MTIDSPSSGSSTKLHPEDGQLARPPGLNTQPSFLELAQPTSLAHMNSALSPDMSPYLPSLEYIEATLWPLDLSISSRNASWAEVCPDNENLLVKFDFLSSLTSANGFANSFRCGSLFQRQQIALMEGIDWEITTKKASSFFGASNASSTPITATNTETPCNTDRMLQRTWGWDGSSTLKTPRLHLAQEFPCLYDWSYHPLALKSQQILDRLRDTVQHKPRNSLITLEWSELVEQTCLIFFSPPNICKFLRIFWSSWYPNCPIVHRPTFDPLSVPPSLLSSMVIIGACLSPEKNDN